MAQVVGVVGRVLDVGGSLLGVHALVRSVSLPAARVLGLACRTLIPVTLRADIIDDGSLR
jgi:hypothetical protein